MRDAELYRRPPFLVGDEVVVLRHARAFRKRRRLVQLGFLGGVAAVGGALTMLRTADLFAVTASFAALSSAFVVLHLAAGKRIWMKPVEAYEDGIAGSEFTRLFCRRRFVAWKEVERVEFATGGGAAKVLRAVVGGGRVIESAPGEFDEAGLSKMQERIARAKADEAAAKALLATVSGEAEDHR